MLSVIRHGQAEGNTSHRLIGWADVPLDEVGRNQADIVGRRLVSAGVERIVSSDIARARQTAAPLAEMLGLEVELDPRLREIDNGDWTGLLPAEIEARWPELWHAYVGGEDVDRPGGERWCDVRQRIRQCMEELTTDSRFTAVFTHGGPIMLAAEWALDIVLPGNIFRGVLAAPANTSITSVDEGKLVTYADAGHLGAISRIDVPYAPVDVSRTPRDGSV
jgi:probable phosphoglycerate mutase